MADRSQVRFETEELGVAGGIILCRRCTNSAYFFARDTAKKPFHEGHLTKSGFGKPKAAKLDNPSDAVLRERGARRRSWGTKAKPLACNPPTALLSARAMPARRFPPPWSVEEQDACYVVG
jgi:hypothetical protein